MRRARLPILLPFAVAALLVALPAAAQAPQKTGSASGAAPPIVSRPDPLTAALANPLAIGNDLAEAAAGYKTPRNLAELDALIASLKKDVAARTSQTEMTPEPGGDGMALMKEVTAVPFGSGQTGTFKFALQDLDDSVQFTAMNSLPATNLYVTDAGPGNVGKRLELEGLADAQDLGARFAAIADGPAARQSAAEELRDLFGATPAGRIVTTLATAAIGTGAQGFSLTEETLARMRAAIQQPEQLATYQRNVARALEQDAARPSFLRIIQGRPVMDPDPFPDTLMTFGFVDNSPQMCSAVLVSPNYAVTAAHCFCAGAVDQVMIGTSLLMDPRRVAVDRAASRTHIDCAALKTADGFSRSIGQGDIALLKLKEPVTDVAIRPLADEETIQFAAAVRAVGFGVTDAAPSPGLRGKFVVDIAISSYDCSDLESSFPGAGYHCAATHELVAAGFGRDTCGGDSGGPIYVFGRDLKVYLAGITSRAVDPTGACGPGGIYVKLSTDRFQEWLTEHGAQLAKAN